MKSISVLQFAFATLAVAQPHGKNAAHQRAHKRGARAMVTEYVTTIKTEYVTEYIEPSTTYLVTGGDASYSTTTSTKYPASSSQAPDQFYEGHTSTAPKAAAPAQAPAYTPSPANVPPPTPAYVAPAASTPQAAAGGGGASNSQSSTVGDMTYYQVGLGSCGIDDTGKDNTANIVALSQYLMGPVSNGNSYCGKTITISYQGKTTQATVHDKCEACDKNSIDVSQCVFVDLTGGTGAGRVNVDWWFN